MAEDDRVSALERYRAAADADRTDSEGESI